MTLGARTALVGMARYLIDSYADYYGAYPQIVATGGDAPVFEDDPLVEHIVPDLVLLGIAEACRRSLMEDPPGRTRPGTPRTHQHPRAWMPRFAETPDCGPPPRRMAEPKMPEPPHGELANRWQPRASARSP